MISEDTDITRTSVTLARRMSWGAIFAGLAVVLVVELMLGFLGIAIGATTVHPMTEQQPMAGLTMGAGIWVLVSTILSLFAGGWVAGRLAGFPRRSDNALHGIVTWASATLLTVFLVGTALGSIVGGAFGLLTKGVSAAGPQIKEAAGAALGQSGVDLESIRQQVKTTFEQRAKDPKAAQANESQLLDALGKLYGGNATDADRQSVVTLLTQNTSMSQDEAQQTVASWEQKIQQGKAQVEQKGREAGEVAATGLARTGWVLFGVVLIGAIAAAIGGAVATRETVVITTTAA